MAWIETEGVEAIPDVFLPLRRARSARICDASMAASLGAVNVVFMTLQQNGKRHCHGPCLYENARNCLYFPIDPGIKAAAEDERDARKCLASEG
ncbi:hypothetical protein [Dyella sp. OK004]|uniref:hypothetical protein n=1 Tax=Dyella sp. OK004 TaxID=1855292 RepID=UPI001160A39C|nr:hypothetical protein [Dyella sp. OK004]